MLNTFLILLLAIIALTSLLDGVHAGTSLMGVGGGGGGMPKGISFNIDTNDKRMTRIHGNSLKVDLDALEIQTSGGKLKYSPTHMEFETGTTRWMTTMSPIKIAFYQNDKAIIQLLLPEDDSPYYYMTMGAINIAVHDLIVDKTLTHLVLLNLCVAEKSIFYSNINMERQQANTEAVVAAARAANVASGEVSDVDVGDSEDTAAGTTGAADAELFIIDPAVLRNQCEQELAGNVPTDMADANAPKLPRHVSSVAQLLEYNSKIMMQQSALLDAVVAAADVSVQVSALKSSLHSHSTRTAASLAVLEHNMEEVLQIRLVEANETVSEALSGLSLTLSEMENAFGEEAAVLRNETQQLVYTAGNATAQEIFNYIFYNVSGPLRAQIDSSVEALQTETAVNLVSALEKMYGNITEGAVADTAALLTEALETESARVLKVQHENLVMERLKTEERLSGLENSVSNRTNKTQQLQVDLKEWSQGQQNVTNQRVTALVDALQLTETSLRNETADKVEKINTAVASMNTSIARKYTDLATAVYTNATLLRDELTKGYIVHVNQTVTSSADILAARVALVNSTLTSDLMAREAALSHRLTETNDSLLFKLSSLNTSLTELTHNSIVSLHTNLTTDVSRHVYEPLRDHITALSGATNNSLGHLNATMAGQLGLLNASVSVRLAQLQHQTDDSLAALEESQRTQNELLHKELMASGVALAAVNSSIYGELDTFNSTVADALSKLQTQLQSDISSVHLIATMVNYTITEGLLVHMRNEAESNHSELIRQLIALESQTETAVNRSMTDYRDLSGYAKQINVTLSDALNTQSDRLTQSYVNLTTSMFGMNTTLLGMLSDMNATLREAAKDEKVAIRERLDMYSAYNNESTGSLNRSLAQLVVRYAEDQSEQEKWKDQWMLPQLQRANATLRRLESDTEKNFTTMYAFLMTSITDPLARNQTQVQEQLTRVTQQLSVDLPLNISRLNASINNDLDSLASHVDTELVHLEAAMISLRDTEVPRINSQLESLLNFSVRATLLQEASDKHTNHLDQILNNIVQPELVTLRSNVTTLLVDTGLVRQRLDSAILSTVEPLSQGVVEASRRLAEHDTAIALLQQENNTIQRLTTLFGDVTSSLAATQGSQITRLQHDLQLAETSLTNVTLYVDRLVNKMEYVVSTNLVTQEAANSRMEDGIRDVTARVQGFSGNITMAELNIKQLQAQNKAKDEAYTGLLLKNKGYDSELEGLQAEKLKLEKTVEEEKKIVQAQAIALQVLESKVAQLERRNADLEGDIKTIKSSMATQDSVDQLRKLLFEMQSSVITHSNKVLDVVISSNSNSHGSNNGHTNAADGRK